MTAATDAPQPASQMTLVVVSGLSGAGKSTALAALEDLGFACVDNLPVPMLGHFVELAGSLGRRRVAVVIDARELGFLDQFKDVYTNLVANVGRVELVFFQAPDDVLVRRFSETRRKHPMGDLPGAIARERDLLREIQALATAVIETGNLRARQLRQSLRDRYGSEGEVMQLVLTSFGFKHGLMTAADMVFDVRFLDNPHEVPELRPQTGLDTPVAQFVLAQPDALAILGHIEGVVRFVSPRSLREGRSSMTVAIGCTGGQHRSVALVEHLAGSLRAGQKLSSPAPKLVVRHRDLHRVGAAGGQRG
ncbi:MAG: RNase adapter RapZ [Nannocystaceae bacterium]